MEPIDQESIQEWSTASPVGLCVCSCAVKNIKVLKQIIEVSQDKCLGLEMFFRGIKELHNSI